jgi:hypothetical protein
MSKWIVALGLTLVAASPAYAFRCGSYVIDEGATRSEVAAKCGDPTEIDRRSAILRRPTVWIGGRPYFTSEALIEIPVEVWIYNLGPNKLMRRLRFENGVLVDIDTLGYGYYENSPPPDSRNRRDNDDQQ